MKPVGDAQTLYPQTARPVIVGEILPIVVEGFGREDNENQQHLDPRNIIHGLDTPHDWRVCPKTS
jgi:hypothetical protein